MGRKIPSKKHRGVKDPIEQQARRMQSLKGKINAPPNDPDEQPVPKSLLRLFAFQNQSKDFKKYKNNKKKTTLDKTLKSTANPISRLKQLPGESGRSFSLRINSAIRALNDPREDEDYPVDLDAGDVKGDRIAAQRERRRRKRPKTADGTPKLSRAQKLAAKLKAKKEAMQSVRPEVQYDRVQFGEVTHGPPSISTLPRKATRDQGAARPGRRDLLLTSMLKGPQAGAGVAERQREQRERTRLDVVAAYRLLKRQQRDKLQTNNTTKHK